MSNNQDATQSMQQGVHIIGDLYDCDFSIIDSLTKNKVSNKISQFIKESGLRELGRVIHQFESGGITAIFALVESHISFHSWPEIEYVSLDVFVCNYSKNNSDNASILYNKIKDMFGSERDTKRILNRKFK